jgi:excisionase family DNA binding protein
VSKSASPLHPGDTQDHLLALPEVARRLACSPGLVRRLDARGVLPRVRLGRLVRYRARDVTRLVTEGVPRAYGQVA